MNAQNLETEMLFPDTLRSTQDSFFISSPKFDKIRSHFISRENNLNLGTSGHRGVSMTIWTDLDTIVIPHVNFPYRQLIKIPIASPTDTAICILRFNPNSSNFSDEYVLNANGTFEIEIPEVYELANIVLYLSQCSKSTGNRPDSEYGKKVIEYFKPFLNHKLIQVLNKNCSNKQNWKIYYGFRENSICFNFEDDFLKYETPYKHVKRDDSGI